MFEKNEIDQTQSQVQFTNISNAEHGMTDEVRCLYLDCALPEMSATEIVKASNLKSVKVLFFKGKVQRVFCHHLEKARCQSKLNKNKRCFLLDAE